MPLRWADIKVLLVASLGQFLGQGLATLVGIILPLIDISTGAGLPAPLQGLLGCISLIGIMIGSAVIGNLVDRYGTLLLFRLCPLVCCLASLAVIIFPNVIVLLVSLFVIGFAIGGEYSLDPVYISELMPDRWKTFMLGVAKAFASAGSVVVAVICYVILSHGISAEKWAALMWIIFGLCALMFVLRLGFAQTPGWLFTHGKPLQAQKAVQKMLGNDVVYDSEQTSAPSPKKTVSVVRFLATHPRQVILTGLPWAFEGLGVYGIGIFLPALVMAFGLDFLPPEASPMKHIINSVGLTFVLCVVMMIGFCTGLTVLRRFRHTSMQIVGFCVSAAGLGLLLAAFLLHWPAWIAVSGFVIFELALNAGPHLITFILPSQVFGVADRGTGAGIAASLGKSGAVAGAFFIPVILHHLGAAGVLITSIIVMLLGALVTLLFKKPYTP